MQHSGMGSAAVGDSDTLATGREQSWMPLEAGIYGPQTAPDVYIPHIRSSDLILSQHCHLVPLHPRLEHAYTADLCHLGCAMLTPTGWDLRLTVDPSPRLTPCAYVASCAQVGSREYTADLCHSGWFPTTCAMQRSINKSTLSTCPTSPPFGA